MRPAETEVIVSMLCLCVAACKKMSDLGPDDTIVSSPGIDFKKLMIQSFMLSYFLSILFFLLQTVKKF